MAQNSIFSSMLWYVGRFFWIGGFMSIGALGLLWFFQERLLFHPGVPPGYKTPDKNPSGMKQPGEQDMDYEDVTIVTDDGVRLHAWFIKQPKNAYKTATTLIFFQGNAGNMGFRIPNFNYLYDLLKVNILSVSYRGYGWSTGSPTEQGLYRDAEAVLFYLYSRTDIDQSKIFVFGRSIGGAVAIDLASKRFPMLRGVIVENTFTNLRDMSEIVFPFFKYVRPLVGRVQRLAMDNLQKIENVNIPLLFIAGLQDTLVPPHHTQQLYQKCRSGMKRLYEVENGTHNETWHQGGNDYYQNLSNFLRDSYSFYRGVAGQGTDPVLRTGAEETNTKIGEKIPAKITEQIIGKSIAEKIATQNSILHQRTDPSHHNPLHPPQCLIDS